MSLGHKILLNVEYSERLLIVNLKFYLWSLNALNDTSQVEVTLLCHVKLLITLDVSEGFWKDDTLKIFVSDMPFLWSLFDSDNISYRVHRLTFYLKMALCNWSFDTQPFSI